MGENQCKECGTEDNLNQHHTSYADNTKVWLCDSCHGKVHQDPSHELYPDYEMERHDSHRTTINIPKNEHRDAKAVKQQHDETWTDVLKFYARFRGDLPQELPFYATLMIEGQQENNPMQEFDWSEFDRRLQDHLNEWEITVNLDQLDLEPVNMDEQDVERIVERELEKTFGDRLPQ